MALAGSFGAVAVVTLAIELFKSFVPVLSLGVLYVFAVLLVAAAWGLRYALPVAVASMLAFNWFHLPPVHTFTLADGANWFALAVYVVVAVAVSLLADRVRRRAAEAEQREREAALLADLASDLLGGRELRRRARVDLRARGRGARRQPGADRARAATRRPRARRRIRSRPTSAWSGRSTCPRARRRASRSAAASCRRWRRCSASRSTASGSSARRSRPRRSGGATRSRRPCCRRSPTTCARR